MGEEGGESRLPAPAPWLLGRHRGKESATSPTGEGVVDRLAVRAGEEAPGEMRVEVDPEAPRPTVTLRGPVEGVLERCTRLRDGDRVRELDSTDQAVARMAADVVGRNGKVVVALAMREGVEGETWEPEPRQMIFLGLLALPSPLLAPSLGSVLAARLTSPRVRGVLAGAGGGLLLLAWAVSPLVAMGVGLGLGLAAGGILWWKGWQEGAN